MQRAALAQPRVLVVEDDPDIIALVQSALEVEGCAITPAESLPASLTLLQEQLFHLVLTDLFRAPGQAFLQSIHPLLAQAAPLPVGILTAWEVPEVAALQAGARFLLRKPFDLDDLVHVVQQELLPRPTSEQQLVEQFFAALGVGDWPRLARLCSPDLTLVPLLAPPGTSGHGPRGLLATRPLLERRFRTLPGYTIEEVLVFARPLGVAARYTASWQSRDGVTHHLAGSMHFRVEGERIVQIAGAF